MSAREHWLHIATASIAAFSCGAVAGAYWMQRRQQHHAEQQLQQHKDLTALPSLTNLSPTPSIAASVCYSLPPTPRFSSSGGGSFNRNDSIGGRSTSDDSTNRLRMVFVVRKDLAWPRQKLAVMTSHAALALFKKLYKSRNPLLQQWEQAKGPKLVLRAENEKQLLEVLNVAQGMCLPTHSIAEATGDPEYPRTRSILAVGPLTVEQLSSISSGLVLL